MRLTCVGVLVADAVGWKIDSLPPPGHLVFVDGVALHIGGNAANAAIAAAKLGVETAIVGRIGADGFGGYIRAALQQERIDTRGLIEDPSAPTSATLVITHTDGERTLLHSPGSNGLLNIADVPLQSMHSGDIMHIASAFLLSGMDGEPMAELLKNAQSEGVITSLDTAWDPSGYWMQKLAPALPYLDYFMPSYEEAKMLANQEPDPSRQAALFHSMGAKTVAIKLGERGCLIRRQDGGEIWVESFKTDVVDTLGAGDAWSGGFLAGLNLGYSLDRCGQLANAVGACCVSGVGATTGLRSLQETLEIMDRR